MEFSWDKDDDGCDLSNSNFGVRLKKNYGDIVVSSIDSSDPISYASLLSEDNDENVGNIQKNRQKSDNKNYTKTTKYYKPVKTENKQDNNRENINHKLLLPDSNNRLDQIVEAYNDEKGNIVQNSEKHIECRIEKITETRNTDKRSENDENSEKNKSVEKTIQNDENTDKKKIIEKTIEKPLNKEENKPLRSKITEKENEKVEKQIISNDKNNTEKPLISENDVCTSLHINISNNQTDALLFEGDEDGNQKHDENHQNNQIMNNNDKNEKNENKKSHDLFILSKRTEVKNEEKIIKKNKSGNLITQIIPQNSIESKNEFDEKKQENSIKNDENDEISHDETVEQSIGKKYEEKKCEDKDRMYKIYFEDIDKIIRLHFSKLSDLMENEKLFEGLKYHTYFMEILDYNNNFWNDYKNEVQIYQNNHKNQTNQTNNDIYSIDNMNDNTLYSGCMDLDDVEKSLKFIQNTIKDLEIRNKTPDCISLPPTELSIYDILYLKVDIANNLLASFKLDNLRNDCDMKPGKNVMTSLQNSNENSYQNLVKINEYFPKNEQISINTLKICESMNSVDITNPVGMKVGIIPSAKEAVDSAFNNDVKNQILTPNSILLLLLRGSDALNAMGENILEENSDSSDEKTNSNRNTINPDMKDIIQEEKNIEKSKKKKSENFLTKRGSKISLSYWSSPSKAGKDSEKLKQNKKNKKDHDPSDNWIIEKTKTLDMWLKLGKDLTVEVKVRTKLPCLVFEVLAILNETELASNWAPMYKYGEKIHQMTRASQLVKQVYDYPVLGEKESILYTYGINALSEFGCIMIFCKSPPENKDFFLQYPYPSRTNIPRIASANLCFLLFPISSGKKTLVEFYANFHHGVKYAPHKMIIFIVKKIINNIFISIAKHCSNFNDSPYLQKVQQNPDLYLWLKNTISEYVRNSSQLQTLNSALDCSVPSFDLRNIE